MRLATSKSERKGTLALVDAHLNMHDFVAALEVYQIRLPGVLAWEYELLNSRR